MEKVGRQKGSGFVERVLDVEQVIMAIIVRADQCRRQPDIVVVYTVQFPELGIDKPRSGMMGIG